MCEECEQCLRLRNSRGAHNAVFDCHDTMRMIHGYRITICKVLWPSSVTTVRRLTPCITSPLAKVWRRQCQVNPCTPDASTPVENQPLDPFSASR